MKNIHLACKRPLMLSWRIVGLGDLLEMFPKKMHFSRYCPVLKRMSKYPSIVTG